MTKCVCYNNNYIDIPFIIDVMCNHIIINLMYNILSFTLFSTIAAATELRFSLTFFWIGANFFYVHDPQQSL